MARFSAHRTSRAGFTLIEVIVTIFLVGIIAATYGSMVLMVSLTRNAQREDIALRIASEKLGVLRAGGYDSLPVSGTFTDPQMSSLPNGAGSISVSDLNAESKQVDVTVSWQDPGKATRSILMSTLIIETGGL